MKGLLGANMKKVIALVMSLAIVMTFFCFDVFAADYQTVGVQTGTYNNSSHQIVISTKIVQLYSHIDSQPIYDGAAYVPFLYTTMVTNNSDQNKLVQGIRVAARYQNLGTRYLSNIENMGSDLFMTISTMATSGWFDCVPSATFSVENAVLVPAHRTLYCVAVVYMECDYTYNNVSQQYVPSPPAFDQDAYVNVVSITDGSGYEFFDPGSDNSGAAFDAALADYIGDPSNGDVIDYLHDLYANSNTTNSSLSTIINRLDTIISAMNSWTGTVPTYSPWQSYSTSATMNHSFNPSQSPSNWCTIYAMPSFEFSEDFEKLTNSTSYFNYTTVIPCQLTYYWEVGDDGFEYNPYFNISNVVKQLNGYSIVGGDLQSNFVGTVRWYAAGGNYGLQCYPDFSNGYENYANDGDTLIMVYNFYIVYSDTNWSYWMTGTMTADSPFFFTQQSTTDSLTNQSNAIGSQSDTIHQQEEVWYNQNSQAMQSVGLSNYQYTTQQYNGILGVTFQFEQLWTALGSWTMVYIFTLMLSLATFILRHRPTTKMQQRHEEAEFYRNANTSYRMRRDPQYAEFLYERARGKK